MVNSTSTDINKLSTTELRRRLTMPLSEGEEIASVAPAPAPAPVLEPDTLSVLRAATRPTVSHNTPAPEETLNTRSVIRPMGTLPPAGSTRKSKSPSQLDVFFPEQSQVPSSSEKDELESLRAENNDLRELLDEMRHLLQEANDADVRQKADLEQKTAKIAELEEILQSFEDQVRAIQEAPKHKNADELEEWADELERENAKIIQLRRDLDADRRQMKLDEQDLERQMREMEVSMAKERAVMARQETELRRLNQEINQELELAQRGDPALRQQMAVFSRRHQDILARAGSAPASAVAPPPVAEVLESSHGPLQAAPTNKSTDSNVFRRLFKKS